MRIYITYNKIKIALFDENEHKKKKKRNGWYANMIDKYYYLYNNILYIFCILLYRNDLNK